MFNTRISQNGQTLKVLCFIVLVYGQVSCDITLSTQDLSLKIGENETVLLKIRDSGIVTGTVDLVVQHTDIARILPSQIELENVSNNTALIIEGLGAGHTPIYANSTNSNLSLEDVYLRVTVYKSKELDIFSNVIGWIYFLAWSVSFYPQIYINWKRKSVVGLNFDFLSLNIVGFTLYAVFNLGLYFIPLVKEEYSNRYPRGLNPVQVNDIFFAVHATGATTFTIFQCWIYERESQRVSTTARLILGAFAIFVLISAILAASSVLHWLDFLYYCSYVKLTITLIKYIPQAYMNYKRKTTDGWSIGNIFLDFTGGMLSMFQMIVNAYNYDDWVSIFGDPTKFGLGLFSAAFDVFFIIQHYVLYRVPAYESK